MRIFGGDRMDTMLTKLGLEDGEAITHPWINKALEKAQSKVEARNFDIRKNLLKYDDVMNDQRKVIFEHRIELMEDEDVSETIADMRHDVADHLVTRFTSQKKPLPNSGIQKDCKSVCNEIFNLDLPIPDWADEEGIADDEIHERLKRAVDEAAAKKAVEFGPERMRQIEKWFLLQTLGYLYGVSIW